MALTWTEKKALLVAYKGGLCEDCGLVFPNCCFQFDHRDLETKTFGISNNKRKSIDDLKTEVDKCDLVCANCHAIRTATNPALKLKVGKAVKQVWKSPETSPKMYAALTKMLDGRKGLKHTPEAKAKMSASRKGKNMGAQWHLHHPATMPQETRDKIAATQRLNARQRENYE